MKGSFVSGLFFWLKGWGFLLSHRTLFMLAILPITLALTLVGFVGIKVWAWVSPTAHMLCTLILGDTQVSAWLLSALYYPLLIGIGLLLVVASVVLTYLLHALLTVPFNGWLAERTLSLRAAGAPEKHSAWHMFRVGLIKTLIFLVLGLILFVLAFVPIVNVVAFIVTLLLLAFDFLDYGFEARRFRFRDRIRFVFQNKSMMAGMVAALALTMLVPGLTLVIAPGAVVGGALLLSEATGRP